MDNALYDNNGLHGLDVGHTHNDEYYRRPIENNGLHGLDVGRTHDGPGRVVDDEDSDSLPSLDDIDLGDDIDLDDPDAQQEPV